MWFKAIEKRCHSAYNPNWIRRNKQNNKHFDYLQIKFYFNFSKNKMKKKRYIFKNKKDKKFIVSTDPTKTIATIKKRLQRLIYIIPANT